MRVLIGLEVIVLGGRNVGGDDDTAWGAIPRVDGGSVLLTCHVCGTGVGGGDGGMIVGGPAEGFTAGDA